MKRKLGALFRVLVSVGILAYLFNSIFQNELKEVARNVLLDRDSAESELARRFEITIEQIQLIKTKVGLVPDPDDPATLEVSLKKLSYEERRSLIWRVGPRSVWRVFQRMHPQWFGMGVLSMGVVCLLGVIRWQMILRVQGLDLRFARVSSIFFVGLFFNAFLLGSTGGDVIKAWYVAHETHHKKAEAIATVVVDRLIGLLALFIIALIMMTLFWHRVFDDPKLRLWAVFTLLVVLTTVAGTALGFWKGFADKLPRLRRWLRKLPRYETLKRMVDAVRVYASHPAVLLRTTLVTIGIHFFSMLCIVFVGRGLRIVTEHGIVDYFLYLPIINSITAVPISISGFGVREGMYAVMFGEVGVPRAQAVAMSLIGYLASLFWSLVGSLFYLTHRKELPPADVIDRED